MKRVITAWVDILNEDKLERKHTVRAQGLTLDALVNRILKESLRQTV